MKFETFAGTHKINGIERRVEVSQGVHTAAKGGGDRCLIVHGLTMDEVMAILDDVNKPPVAIEEPVVVAAPTVVDVEVHTDKVEVIEVSAAETTAAVEPEEKPKRKRGRPKGSKNKPKTAKQQEADAWAEAEEKAAEVAEDEPVVEEPTVEEESSDNGAGLLGELQGVTKMRDLLTILHQHGCANADEAIEKAEELKESIPILQRVGDLPKRIERAWDIIGL